MRSPRLNRSYAVSGSKILLAAALLLSAAGVSAQKIYRQVDSEGHTSFSDRREAPITHRELAPLPDQTGPVSEIHGRGPNGFGARARIIDQNEANRRLQQAERERARGPDMQQGIPPIAEREHGDRRRQRVNALQQMVESAQARVRELSAPISLAPSDSRAVGRAVSRSVSGSASQAEPELVLSSVQH